MSGPLCKQSTHGLGGSVSRVRMEGLVRELVTDCIKECNWKHNDQSEAKMDKQP